MASNDNQFEIVPSLLDRLLDDQRDVSRGRPNRLGRHIQALKDCVARDLENMLNTRRETFEDLPEEYAETGKSILVYGLPDFSSFSLLNPGDRDLLRRAIERAIACFEPRLQRPIVTMETPNQNDRSLRFRVDALLRVEPTPEPVVFDTILEPGTQKYLVTGQD